MPDRLSLATLLLAVTLAGSAARAETPHDRAAALTQVREGNRLLDAGDAAGALARFERARALVNSPKLHFNLGQALVGIPGRESEAHEEFTKYLDEVPDAAAGTRDEAVRQVQALRGKIALLTISTDPEGAELTIDAQARGVTPLARPLPVAPGSHAVRLAKPGFAAVTEVIRVESGGEWTKDYRLAPVVVTPNVLATPPMTMASTTLAAKVTASTPGRPDERRKLRVAAGVGVGGGLALAVAGVFAYRTGASKLDHIMQSSMTGGRYSESDGSYQAWGDSGVALMIAGGVVFASAVVLYWLNRADDKP
jgi:hypothetical protein